MDWYTKELLARAVEAAQDNELSVWRDEDGWNVDSPTCLVKSGPTLADALTALLADLGEPVPWRPSAEDVAEAGSRIATLIANGATCDEAVDQAVEDFGRLAVEAALLEGGEA